MNKYLIIAAMLAPFTSQAGEMYGNVDYLNGWQLPDGSYQTAIEFDLNEGWKTYWRTPGPAGIPPTFDWSGSQNVADIEIIWPTPKIFDSYGLISIGYEGHTALPVRITPIQKGIPVNVDLRLEFGVCSDVCVPANARLVTNIHNKSENQGVSDIKTALAEAPLDAKSGGIRDVSCQLIPTSSGFDIRADLQFTSELNDHQLTVIEYTNPDIWIDLPESSEAGNKITSIAAMEYYGDGMMMVDRGNIVITVFDKSKTVEIKGCPAS